MTPALGLLATYLVGAIPFGYLLARAFAGVDVRTIGSGNIGATNVLRAGGKKLAVATLMLDMAKGLVPVLVAQNLTAEPGVAALVGLTAFLGHCYPVYLGFKGGKGVATGLGVIAGLSPAVAGAAAAAFLAVVLATRWVSLASMVAATLIPIALYLTGRPVETDLVMAAMAVIVIVRHRANIERILAGTEPKFGKSAESGAP